MASPETEDSIQSCLQRLPKETQWLLQYAACLTGLTTTSFPSVATLGIVWKAAPESKLLAEEDGSIRYVDLDTLLGQCEKEMLIEKCSGEEEEQGEEEVQEYQWKNDKIRETALNLNSSRTTEFQFRAGMALLSELSEEELEPKLFWVVDLINSGTNNHHKSEESAALNCKASKKARDLSDLELASVYAAKGISMLPSGKRLSDFTLAMELYTIGSQIEMMFGNADRVQAYANDFLRVNDWTVMEAMPVRISRAICTKVTTTMEEKKYEESIRDCLLLLKQLDCKLLSFSRQWRFASKFQAKWTLSKTIKAVQKKKRAFFEKSMRPIPDERHKAIAVLVCQINNAAYHTKEISLAVLCTCKAVQLSLEHGLHAFSGPSMMALADLVDGNDATTSSTLYGIGSMLQQKHHRGPGESSSSSDTYSWYGSEWTKPLGPFANDNS